MRLRIRLLLRLLAGQRPLFAVYWLHDVRARLGQPVTLPDGTAWEVTGWERVTRGPHLGQFTVWGRPWVEPDPFEDEWS